MISIAQLEELRKEVDKIILHDTEIELDKTPGFVIGVIDRDTTFYLDYGNDGSDKELKLDENTVFEIGSATKVFTAGLVEILVDQGLLSYDEKVNDLLPKRFLNPRMEELNIEDLILHLSGLPKRPHLFGKKEKSARDPYAEYTDQDLLEFYSEFVPEKKYKKKKQYRYAHTNYALLEIALENKFNLKFSDLLEHHIFDVLNLSDTFVKNDQNHNLLITPGFDRAGRQAGAWHFESFRASEGVRASTKDLCTYLRANMGISNTPLDGILPATLKVQSQTNYDKNIFVGKAWHIVDHGSKYNIIMHSGTTGGHKAIMAFVDETKTGIVVLANSTIGTQDLGMLILRMINYNWKRKV